MDEGKYKTMYDTSCMPPKFYGLPKIHKTGTLSGQLYQVELQLLMGLLRPLLKY